MCCLGSSVRGLATGARRRRTRRDRDPDGVGVAGAARDRALVDVLGPRVVLAAAVRERADRVSQTVIARPAVTGPLDLPDSTATGDCPP